jgi:hypothetical protein
MLQFVVGFALGAWATVWYQKSRGNQNLEHRMAEVQVRLNTLVGEARRVVDEVRKGVEDRFPAEEPPAEEPPTEEPMAEEPPPEEQPSKEEPGPAATN